MLVDLEVVCDVMVISDVVVVGFNLHVGFVDFVVCLLDGLCWRFGSCVFDLELFGLVDLRLWVF